MKTLLLSLCLLAGCGKAPSIPLNTTTEPIPAVQSIYPYSYNMMCNGQITGVLISSAADLPARCPN